MCSNKETIAQLSTVQDFIDWGARKLSDAGLFYGHGTENAMDEAAYLILHTLNLPYDLAPEELQAELPVMINKPYCRFLTDELPSRSQRPI